MFRTELDRSDGGSKSGRLSDSGFLDSLESWDLVDRHGRVMVKNKTDVWSVPILKGAVVFWDMETLCRRECLFLFLSLSV